MQESGTFQITHHSDGNIDSKHGKVIFSHREEDQTMAFYRRQELPRPGCVMAAWHPDGGLIAFTYVGRAAASDLTNR
jgi:hypothetical protein